MSWIRGVKQRDGSFHFWILDRRDGRHISIDGGNSLDEALKRKDRYDTRHGLEKEGYDDQYTIDPVKKEA